MKLVNILCKDCRHHMDFHTESHMEYTLKHPQGKIVNGEGRPQKGYVYCEKLADLASASEYSMEMPEDGFCSYGEPVELKDITNDDK